MSITDFSVLLVDDNHTNQEMGRAMIEALGCRIDVASNGYEALDRVECTRYDIIFMDCQMPLLDGLEATRLIRRQEKQQGRPRVVIVAMTGDSADEGRRRCLDAGMDDHLCKPFRMDDLSHIIEKWSTDISILHSAACSEELDTNPVSSGNGAGNCLDRRSLDNIRSLGPDGPRILSEIINIYLNDSPILLDRLNESFNASDAQGVAKAAHSLKSTSAGLGAAGLAAICKQVEDMARGNSIDGVNALISMIGSRYEEVKRALKREVQEGC
jgi:CheY-like chemotaxis protein